MEAFFHILACLSWVLVSFSVLSCPLVSFDFLWVLPPFFFGCLPYSKRMFKILSTRATPHSPWPQGASGLQDTTKAILDWFDVVSVIQCCLWTDPKHFLIQLPKFWSRITVRLAVLIGRVAVLPVRAGWSVELAGCLAREPIQYCA